MARIVLTVLVHRVPAGRLLENGLMTKDLAGSLYMEGAGVTETDLIASHSVKLCVREGEGGKVVLGGTKEVSFQEEPTDLSVPAIRVLLCLVSVNQT